MSFVDKIEIGITIVIKWWQNRDDVVVKKNGFTIVELVAAIGIMALIVILVAPSLFTSSTNAREKAYRTKITIIEKAAVLYGQDHYREIVNDANLQSISGSLYYVKTIAIGDLVPKYIEKDVETGTKFIFDPRDNTKFLDDYEITIMIAEKTKKVTAKFDN